MSLRIQVVTKPGAIFGNTALISHLADQWRADGHKVDFGSIDRLDADIGILHINRTWIDTRYLPKSLNGRLLLNGDVVDISKRSFSQQILAPDTNYEGAIIIKTNGNCLERPDRGRLASLLFFRWRFKLAKATTWRLARELPGPYPVLPQVKDVPGWVWKRDDLLVEKFIPEMDGDTYVLRMWMFLGDCEYGVKMWSSNPVVKAGNLIRYEYLKEVPQELRNMRTKLNFDFGKFDYVMVNGEAVLLDINTTPSVSADSSRPSQNIANLAQGIHSFIET